MQQMLGWTTKTDKAFGRYGLRNLCRNSMHTKLLCNESPAYNFGNCQTFRKSPFGVALGFPPVQIAKLAPDSVLAKVMQQRTVLPGFAQS